MDAKTPRSTPPKSEAQHLVTVTERAAQELKTAIAAQTEAYQGVRLGVAGGGCCGPGYMLALAQTAEPDDVVVEVGGVKVFLAQADKDSLKGAVLDFVETPMGSGFHVENPNAVATGHGHGQGHGHEHAEGGCACGGGGGGCGSGGCGC